MNLCVKFCEGASGAILFFDLDSPPSFDELTEWLTIIRNRTKCIPIILCGANWAQNFPEHILLEAKHLADFVNKHKLDGYFTSIQKQDIISLHCLKPLPD